jgi:type IV pilus biogenesis protein CpaD/CtpE
MNTNWKRIYVFAGFAAVAFAGTSMQQNADIPHIVSEAQAEEITTPYSGMPMAGPNARVLEIAFSEADSSVARATEDQIRSFFRGVGNEGRIREIKVVVWAGANGDQAQNLARERVSNLRSVLAAEANLSTYSIFPERSTEDGADHNQAAVIAVLE